MSPKRAFTALPSLEQWKSETAVFGRRSPGMLGIDIAYATYLKASTSGNAQALFDRLDAYLAAHGGYWAKVDRDVKSGGMMEFVYEKARFDSGNGPISVRIHGRDGSVVRIGNVDSGKAALAEEAAHARLGVLYLFAKTDVSTQHLKVFLEGGFGTLGAAGKLIPAGDVGSKSIEIGSKIGGKATGFIKGKETAQALPMKVQPQKPQFQSIAGSAPSPAWVPIDELVGGISPMGDMGFNATLAMGKAWADLMEFLTRQLTELWDWIVAKVRMNEGAAWTATGTVAKGIISAAVAYVAKSAAPLVGAAMDIGKGVAEVIRAVKARVTAALLHARFTINPGHPELMANAIQNALNWAIGSGLWSTVKGCGKLGLTFVSAGASVIGDVVVAACEFITKSIIRLIEADRIKAFLTEAKSLYEKDLDKKPGSIVNDPVKFTEFYQRGCAASACIPMLTLNSGICGDLMQMMKMFDDARSAKQVTQEMFDAGSDYFRQLKIFGKDYLKNSGFAFSAPADEVVQGLLSHAVSHHDASALRKGDKLLAALVG